MHGRIQELAVKANLYVDVNGQPWPRNMNGEDIEGAYQKFAQLIVDECCTRLSEEIIRHDGHGFNQHELYNRLRKHFGIDK